MDIKNCLICNKEFGKRGRSFSWWKRAKYCSVGCSAKSKIGKPGGMLSKTSPNKGKKMSEEQKKKLSIAHMGKTAWNKGLKLDIPKTKKWYEAMKEKMSGKNNPRWLEDRTQVLEKHRLRGTQEWKVWRGEVFERDNYTCQECGVSGVYLEPHHITPIRSDMNRIFDINNGITLCRPCHLLTMGGKELNFAEKYYAKIMIQV